MAWCKINFKTELPQVGIHDPSLEIIIECDSVDFIVLQDMARAWLSEFDKSFRERQQEHLKETKNQSDD